MPKVRSPYKSGNSVVLSLPKDLRQEVGIDTETDVMIEADGDQLVVRPVEFHPAHRAGGQSP